MNVIAIATSGRHVIVGRADVDLMLDNGCECHADTSEDEAPCDACDRVHGETSFPQEWIDDFIEERDAKDDDDRINVLHLIVGHVVKFHLAGLSDEIGGELVVNDPIDRIEEEDSAGNEGTAEFVDEGFTPRGFVFLAVGWGRISDGDD